MKTTSLGLFCLFAAWSLTACDEGGRADDASAAGGKSSTAATSATGGSPGTTAGSTGGTSGFTGTVACQLPQSCEPGESEDHGVKVTVSASADQLQVQANLAEQLGAVAPMTAEQFAAKYATGLSQAAPSYDPTVATGMSVLQGSSLALGTDELARLTSRGFVITEKKTFPSYVYGYETFYNLDLPLYVSADSVLFAVHQSFDSLLRDLELNSLIPALQQILDSARGGFDSARAAGISDQALVDADLYLTVAKSLLAGAQVPTVAGAKSEDVACILQGVASLEGCVQASLFGASHVFDFSQFTIRGHYTSDPLLGRYFQAMMWLGRTDLRLIETEMDGSQTFHRRQLEAALAMRELLDAESRANWQKIDRVVGAFVGEHDSMTLPQLDGLLSDLGATSLADLATIPDGKIAQTIIAGGYGAQRIASQIMINPDAAKTYPLASVFLLFGQRYIVDSHVFSNVVYDRVIPGVSRPRMLPNPLDVAFGALGNNQAGELLATELSTYGYAPNLESARILVDAHPAEYWDGNLYNHWIGALRALSTAAEAKNFATAGLPSVAGTEAWGRRLLNTQLASWSELRHDTLLYAKQSYTSGFTLCEYPDAYVEPYPAFWAKLVSFAEYGKALAADLGLPTTGAASSSAGAYFEQLRQSATILQQMAERQRTGAPHDPAHIAFINNAVRTSRAGGGGCGGSADATDATGWYADLFYKAADKVVFDPNIADVHTQPTDELGGIVGHVLHVGTGMPRLMVVTAENCTGPHAYVGLVSSYFERTTDDFKRLTDEEWSAELLKATPEDVSWMKDLVIR